MNKCFEYEIQILLETCSGHKNLRIRLEKLPCFCVVSFNVTYSGFQAKVCTTFLALAWLLSLSACSNASDSHLRSHTHDYLPIEAIEIYCKWSQEPRKHNFLSFKKSLIFYCIFWGPVTIYIDFSGSNWQYIMGM